MSNSVLQQNSMNPNNNQNNVRRDDPDESPGPNRPQENSGSTQDIIVNSYQNLVQRYDSLVRNYQRLFMVRHRLTVTPPPPSTVYNFIITPFSPILIYNFIYLFHLLFFMLL